MRAFLSTAAAVGVACTGGAAQSAVSEAVPDWHSPKAVMLWAKNLDRRGWDYLGSADDAIYFVSRPKRQARGRLTFALRGEFFDHAQVGEISSSIAVFEADCDAFSMRRLSARMLSEHDLKGRLLKNDTAETDWFDPPGVLIPAAITGACLTD